MTVFYTSLGTDIDSFGISIPLGYVPAWTIQKKLNTLTLENFMAFQSYIITLEKPVMDIVVKSFKQR